LILRVYRPTYIDPKTGKTRKSQTWWYEFVFNGEHIRESTKVKNKRTAEQIEAARKTQLAKGEVGIKHRSPAPTLKEFEARFIAAIATDRAEHPETVSFYKEKYRRLLEHPPMANARLDAIDEDIIDTYKQTRRRQISRYGRAVSPGSVNRELATLSRALRLALKVEGHYVCPGHWAARWRAQPGIRTRPRGRGNLSRGHAAAAGGCGRVDAGSRARIGEASQLVWADVFLKPAIGARHGYVRIRWGKSKNASCTLSLTPRLAEMLKARKAASESEWVFPGESPDAPILVTSLDHQHNAVREILNLSTEFVIHSLRHTMLTRLEEAGADAFAIMKIAGHSSVTVSQRYVHPSPDSLERAFKRLDALNAAKRERAPKAPKDSPKVEILEMPSDRL
jgi:integrase